MSDRRDQQQREGEQVAARIVDQLIECLGRMLRMWRYQLNALELWRWDR